MCLAIPGRVVAIDPGDDLLRMGRVDFGGVVKEVSLACVPDVALGDFVLVHAGMAIARVDAAEAERIFAALREIDELGRAQERAAGGGADSTR
ncbi:MAG: HypC/HybG/HupF family hydrogenase formation chaperone [Planctomycetes bacterium]|nr:HypC/HybG/HupF family hydrogenase formation chaperone [Planctomycetota bacterium]